LENVGFPETGSCIQYNAKVGLFFIQVTNIIPKNFFTSDTVTGTHVCSEEYFVKGHGAALMTWPT
jgi:hypothetical protein